MPKTSQLIKDSFTDMWRMRASLVPIILLVMIPVLFLALVTDSDQTLGAYGSFATLIMNVAVVSTVIRLKSGSKSVSLGQAYYGGTTRFVAFMCVIGLLGIQLVPLLIGGLIYLSGSTGATVGLGPVEIALLGSIWLLFALPTLRWLTRAVFALYLVQDPDVSPLMAVRQSGALVRGASWRVFGAILAGAVLMLIVLIVPSLAISTLPTSASMLSKIATAFLQLLSALILVPFASIYGYNILEALGAKPKTS